MTLKILLYSQKFTPASRVYIYDLKEKLIRNGLKVDINKFNNSTEYDYLFLMGNDENFQKIRNKNPKIKLYYVIQNNLLKIILKMLCQLT